VTTTLKFLLISKGSAAADDTADSAAAVRGALPGRGLHSEISADL
jgi:hypothetical protein